MKFPRNKVKHAMILTFDCFSNTFVLFNTLWHHQFCNPAN